jgi:outer membrane lipoprotein SlyB
MMAARVGIEFASQLIKRSICHIRKAIMAQECVVAVYESGVRAQLALEKLLATGFPKAGVSVVARSIKGAETDVKKALQFGDEMERDGTLGAGLGAIVGALGGGTVMTAFGASVLVVAGPLVALTGAIVGGLVGAIAGWGIHRDQAAKYQQKIEAGKVLLLAHDADPRKVAEAEKMLRLTSPEELHLHAKVDDADDPRVDDG